MSVRTHLTRGRTQEEDRRLEEKDLYSAFRCLHVVELSGVNWGPVNKQDKPPFPITPEAKSEVKLELE